MRHVVPKRFRIPCGQTSGRTKDLNVYCKQSFLCLFIFFCSISNICIDYIKYTEYLYTNQFMVMLTLSIAK